MEIRMQSGQVVTEQEFRSIIKEQGGPSWDVTTPEVLASLGADVVLEGPQATCDRYQFSMRQGVEQIDGKWYTKYVAGPIFTDTPADGDKPAQTAAEQMAAYKAQKDTEQAKAVRTQRDDKLAESDWRVIKALESNTPQDFAWAAYRQALRDITTQSGFPWEMTWPAQP